MKLKFCLHGLHPTYIQDHTDLLPHVLYDEAVAHLDKEIYGGDIEQNKQLIAYSDKAVPTQMWVEFKLKKL